MSSDEVTVRVASDADLPEVLGVLCDAYGEERFDPVWFAWKHQEGPWGPSVVHVAELDGRLIGCFSVLPWQYLGPSGPVPGVRLVDGGTRQEAQGRGILRSITKTGREAWEAANDGISTATATPTAQRVHLRNGATALDPVGQAFSILAPRPAALREGTDVLDSFTQDATGLTTDWSPDALRWRFDERAGLASRFVALRSADEPHGAVVRRARVQGVPTLVVELTWGPEPTVTRLLRAAMWESRTALLLSPSGLGAAPVPARPVRPSGSTLLCVWDTREDPGPDRSMERAGWRLTLADVGGVM